MKKILFTVCVTSLFYIMCVQSQAARVEGFPMTVAKSVHNGTGNTETYVITDFCVTDISAFTDEITKLSFNICAEAKTDFPELVLECFDKDGSCITAVEISVFDVSAYIPCNTAMVELKALSEEDACDSYLYCNFVNVYSSDGRALGVHDLLVPSYERVGWYSHIKVYSEDGRVLEILPYELEAYESVGWYTRCDFEYNEFSKKYRVNKERKDHIANLCLVEEYLPGFFGTEYESSLYAVRTEAIYLHSLEGKEPLACSGYRFDIRENAGYVILQLTNADFKKVISLKVSFDVLDADGKVTGKSKDYYYATGAKIKPGEKSVFIWQVDEMVNPECIGDFSVLELVYEDNTKKKY